MTPVMTPWVGAGARRLVWAWPGRPWPFPGRSPGGVSSTPPESSCFQFNPPCPHPQPVSLRLLAPWCSSACERIIQYGVIISGSYFGSARLMWSSWPIPSFTSAIRSGNSQIHIRNHVPHKGSASGLLHETMFTFSVLQTCWVLLTDVKE